MLKTTKTRNQRQPQPRFEATMQELKRDAEAGVAYFWGRRPHLHMPATAFDTNLRRRTA